MSDATNEVPNVVRAEWRKNAPYSRELAVTAYVPGTDPYPMGTLAIAYRKDDGRYFWRVYRSGRDGFAPTMEAATAAVAAALATLPAETPT